MPEKQFKTYQAITTKIDEDQGIVEAIVSVFGVIDYGKDRIKPGAFRKTISERKDDILVLDQHNTNSIMNVVGKVLDIKEVGKADLPPEVLKKYPEATGGLWTQTKYLLDTEEGKGAFIRLKEGAVRQYSIGYDALDVTFENVKTSSGDMQVRNLRTIKLYEYGPVLWGMNPATATTDVKNSDGTEPDEDKNEQPVGETPAESQEEKEMAPNGPIKRLGDTLLGNLNQTFTMIVDGWLISGYISQDERGSIEAQWNSAYGALYEGMGDELATRAIGYVNGGWASTTPEVESKDSEPVSEAGPSDQTPTFDEKKLLDELLLLEVSLTEAENELV